VKEKTQRFPPKALFGAAVLIAFTIITAATARLTGFGSIREPQASASQTRELRFDDRPDGAISITQASDGQTVSVIKPGTDGFIRTVMRSLARERRLHDGDRQVPFRLTRWADGRLSIEDPTTGRRIDLGAFGTANTQAFARLIGREATLNDL
jgi:putative photosynthetic complex assembly protein